MEFKVTPLVGVWIEIPVHLLPYPSPNVTPLVGVWIEIACERWRKYLDVVTPLVGVWIEMTLSIKDQPRYQSLPLWECGLKYHQET